MTTPSGWTPPPTPSGAWWGAAFLVSLGFLVALWAWLLPILWP
jgi:hypothetical protein